MDRSGCQICFNNLNKSVISLSVTIRALDSPLGPHPESDLEIYLYSVSTPDNYQDESDHRISSRRLQEIYNIATDIYSGSA
jgi:hypothetical protein